jgi:hypothetical protein
LLNGSGGNTSEHTGNGCFGETLGLVSEAARQALSGAREVLLQGSFYEVSLALVGVASLA